MPQNKSKTIPLPNALIALGNKSGSSSGTKRDSSSVSGISTSLKKAKLARNEGSSSSSKNTVTGGGSGRNQSVSEKAPLPVWETLCEEIDPAEVTSAILLALKSEDFNRIDVILCSCVRLLRSQRTKPDTDLSLTLLTLSKTHEIIFKSNDHVVQAFCSLLKRDVKDSYKPKGSHSLVPVLAACTMMAAFRHEQNWPESFVRVYIEDAISERLWVDHPSCRSFVENIVTSFGTKVSLTAASSLLCLQTLAGSGRMAECPSPPIAPGSRPGSGSATPTRVAEDDAGNVPGWGDANSLMETMDLSVSPRYQGSNKMIEQMVMEIVREQLNRRQGTDNITRNFLKFLTAAAGLLEVRSIVIQKLEIWILNPKISRPAQDLLMAVAVNCSSQNKSDVEVIGNFTKFRLKNKPNINLYLQCTRELCLATADNLPCVMQHTVFNEMSSTRNPNNMSMMTMMFQVDPERFSSILASLFIELLLQKDDFLRSLRSLLREVVRAMRNELNLYSFCHHLLHDRSSESKFRDCEFKERLLASIIEIVTSTIFMSVSPGVRESLSMNRCNEKRDLTAFKGFLQRTSYIQRDAILWLRDQVPQLLKPDNSLFLHSLNKVLLLLCMDEYTRIENWCPENEKILMSKAVAELPVCTETITAILSLGIDKNLPPSAPDTINLVDHLIRRAAGLQVLETPEDDFRALPDKEALSIFDSLFRLSTYHYPESITLPSDYQPPVLAVSSSYWKAWIVIVIMAAHNPLEFGALAWENYPTCRAFMEMCITNTFVFPPITTSGELVDKMKTNELQIAALEKQSIFNLEVHLAAATSNTVVTESNSCLLSQLTTMDTVGPMRRPPPDVLEQLRQTNLHYKLGQLLCKSRSPDFLLNIISRQDTSTKTMPWLAELFESCDGAFGTLPVQCLCEFLLSTMRNNGAAYDLSNVMTITKQRKQQNLICHLQSLLNNPQADPQACCEILDYFLRRLSSHHTDARLQALCGLKMILSKNISVVNLIDDDGDECCALDETQVLETDSTNEWLLRRLPNLPCFKLFYRDILLALRQACQVEHNPDTVSLYIQFLACYAPSSMSDLGDLCLDIASFIVERSIMLPSILPGPLARTEFPEITYASLLSLFLSYMIRIQQSSGRPGSWSNSQEMITVLWSNGKSATLHFFVVHAQIILLTIGGDSEHFNSLLHLWHPNESNIQFPRAFLVDTSEEAVLIPDWLKLKMIRSNVEILVDWALSDLDPHQLLLFIQSFGIPVSSISKLLHTLDVAVSDDREAVDKAVMDTAYMGQLVAVQHRRGATCGYIFAHALNLDITTHGQERKKSVESLLSHKTFSSIPSACTSMDVLPSQLPTYLLKIFCTTSDCQTTKMERLSSIRILMRSVRDAKDVILNATIETLSLFILNNDDFVDGLIRQTSLACSLFRLISNTILSSKCSSTTLTVNFVTVCHNLLDKLRLRSLLDTPLCGLISDFVSRSEDYKIVEKSHTNDLPEPDLTSHFNQEVQSLTDSMASVLVMHLPKNLPLMRDVGTIIDRLNKIDPEMSSVSSECRLSLLFKRHVHDTCRPHLLTTITHGSSWVNLRGIINTVLSEFSTDNDPSAVLNFIHACFYIPKLWAGRDKYICKTHDIVLGLKSQSQTLVLMQYILQEFSEQNDNVQLENRIDLLLKCRFPAALEVKYLIDHLVVAETEFNRTSATQNAIQALIFRLYVKVPKCLLHLEKYLRKSLTSTRGMGRYTCPAVDIATHHLFTALAATQSGRQWAIHIQDIELAIRKLSSTHQILVLRNFPLLSTSLKGRVSVDFFAFRSRNHMILFTISLGIFECLIPEIFDQDYRTTLDQSLSYFIEMIEVYFAKRDLMSGLISNFIFFLHEYVAHNFKNASEFIRDKSTVLIDLYRGVPKHHSLGQLISCVGLDNNLISGSPLSVSARIQSAQPEITHIKKSIAKLSVYSLDNDLAERACVDLLNASSNSRYFILASFIDEIGILMSHELRLIRSNGYILFDRLLRISTVENSGILANNYLDCLKSADDGVILTALEKLPEICVSLPQQASTFLQTVFALGLYSSVKVGPHLTSTIEILNKVNGY